MVAIHGPPQRSPRRLGLHAKRTASSTWRPGPETMALPKAAETLNELNLPN